MSGSLVHHRGLTNKILKQLLFPLQDGKYPLTLFFILLIVLPLISTANAQTKGDIDPVLSSVSIAKRHDHKGYVVRFSMNTPADSFVVIQPSHNLVQVAIYKSNLNISAVDSTSLPEPVDSLDIEHIPYGIGVNLVLNDSSYFIASAYPDINHHDLLVALTKASRKNVNVLTKGMQRIDWSALNVSVQPNIGTVKDVSDPPVQPVGFNKMYKEQKEKLKFDVVVIDAGHGGKDPGTIGWHHIEEKNIALKVALKVGHYIKENLPGVKVVYTRHNDTFIPLEERGHIANKAQGDLFISIHCNSSPDHRAHGTEIYFLGMHRSPEAFEVMKKENSVVRLEGNGEKSPELTEEQLLLYELANSGYMENSEKLATILDHQFADRADRHTRGVRQAGFVVLYYASMPAILVELGFLSNPKEARFLNSDHGQSIMASAIFRAVKKYKEEYDRSQNFVTK